jgi:ribosomal-protein-alanine N-acetyltransferase
VVIDEAALADLPAVLALDRSCSPVYRQISAYQDLLEHSGLILLARSAEELAGFAACSLVLDQATLLNLAVAPSSRRLGVARALLRQTASSLAACGVNRLLLEVRESNVAAQALYRSEGFARDGQRSNYYPGNGGPRETAVLMSLRLETFNAST